MILVHSLDKSPIDGLGISVYLTTYWKAHEKRNLIVILYNFECINTNSKNVPIHL